MKNNFNIFYVLSKSMKNNITKYNYLIQGLVLLLTVIIIPNNKLKNNEIIPIVLISLAVFVLADNLFPKKNLLRNEKFINEEINTANNYFTDAQKQFNLCSKGGSNAKEECRRAKNNFDESIDFWEEKNREYLDRINNISRSVLEKENALKQQNNYLSKINKEVAIAQSYANKKKQDIDSKLLENERKHWKIANSIWSCPSSDGEQYCAQFQNSELYNQCTSDPVCLCREDGTTNYDKIPIDNIVNTDNLNPNNWQCPAQYNGKTYAQEAPKCIGLGNIGTSNNESDFGKKKCDNQCKDTLDKSKSCISQFNKAIEDIKDYGKILHEHSIPQRTKGKQFNCYGLKWKGPNNILQNLPSKQIRTAIIPGCKGWKCDMSTVLNPYEYSGKISSRGTIFDKFEPLDGKFDPITRVKRPGPFRTESSCKVRFPKIQEESLQQDHTVIPFKYNINDSAPNQRNVYNDLQSTELGPIPWNKNIINNNSEGWSTELYNASDYKKVDEVQKYRKMRPIHDPDNVIPEHIVSRNLKEITNNRGEKRSVCGWYFDEAVFGENVNKDGKINIYLPNSNSKNCKVNFRLSDNINGEDVYFDGLYDQSSSGLFTWGNPSDEDTDCIGSVRLPELNETNIDSNIYVNDRQNYLRCYSSFCRNLRNKWGGSVWSWEDAKKGLGPKQFSLAKDDESKNYTEIKVPMRYIGVKLDSNGESSSEDWRPSDNVSFRDNEIDNQSEIFLSDDGFNKSNDYSNFSIWANEITSESDLIKILIKKMSDELNTPYNLDSNFDTFLKNYPEKNVKSFPNNSLLVNERVRPNSYDIILTNSRAERAIGTYKPKKIGIYKNTQTYNKSLLIANYARTIRRLKGDNDVNTINNAITNLQGENKNLYRFLVKLVDEEILVAKKIYRLLSYVLNPPKSDLNSKEGWLDKLSSSITRSQVISGVHDANLPQRIVIGQTLPEACNCKSIEADVSLENASPLVDLNDEDCLGCHPYWNSTYKDWIYPNNNDSCPTKCGGNGVLYFDPETKKVKFVNQSGNNEKALQCIPTTVYDPNPEKIRTSVNKEQLPAKKLTFLPPEQNGYDLKKSLNQYCNYEDVEGKRVQYDRNIQQPNAEWLDNRESIDVNSYPKYPGSCKGLSNDEDDYIIELNKNRENAFSCGKTITIERDGRRVTKSDGKGLVGKEPKCCRNFITQGSLEEGKTDFEEENPRAGPDDYTFNDYDISRTGRVVYQKNENEPAQSKIATPRFDGDQNKYIWKPSYYQRAKTSYPFKKKLPDGTIVPNDITELVSNASSTGLKGMGNVFLNEHGLILNEEGKCCDPSLYGNNDDSISDDCGSGCSEINLINPIDNLENNWTPLNSCTQKGYSGRGIKTSDCISEAETDNLKMRNAKQLRAWFMTRLPNDSNTSKPGQVLTCVNNSIANKMTQNLQNIKESRKILDGDDLNNAKEITRDSKGFRVLGKFGLSDIMGNMLDNEFTRMKEKEENLIKAYSKIGSNYSEIDYSDYAMNYGNNEEVYIENSDGSRKSRNPSLKCPHTQNSEDLSSIPTGDCIVPTINKTDDIMEVINKFEKRNNCGINKNESCSKYQIKLSDIILSGRNQVDDVSKNTHWADKSLNCDDVCFCYPESGICDENDPNCPHKCSCSRAKTYPHNCEVKEN